ncbi:MAG: asparagine synthase (glutamine-hydrolyzing) [Acidobacteria bacterium]|nr:asparagine synthase (glutamine-hydrolyzing) [Acidobacteriota bacterium]
MSGIAGLIMQNPDERIGHIVKEMCDIQHGYGTEQETACIQNKLCCFGNCRRVRTRTGEKSAELIMSEDKTVIVALDASIFNVPELKDALGDLFPSSTPASSAAILMQLYKKFGTKFFERLRGDFAFALWDERKKILLVARDRFGIRPLFYSQKPDGTFLFASQLKALIKSRMVDRELDFNALYHYLFFTFVPQPQTLFKHVKSLPPGCFLIYAAATKQLKIEPYWDIPLPDNKVHDKEYIIAHTRELFDEAIKTRISPDEISGVSLSGGIDSSAIAAKLAQFGARPPKTFTFGFGHESAERNEWRYAKLVSEKIGSDHTELTFSGKNILTEIPQIMWHFNTPTAGALGPYFFAKAASQVGIDIGFRGDGGNSGFEYPVDGKFPILDKLLLPLELLPDKLKNNLFKKMSEKIFTPFYFRFRNSSPALQGITGLAGRYFNARSGSENITFMLSEMERKSLFLIPFWQEKEMLETSDLVLETMNRVPLHNTAEKVVYEEYKRYCDQGLIHISGISSAFGVELRLPYYDHALVEFIQRIPLNYRINKSKESKINKAILQAIMQEMLPHEITVRKQWGFFMPMDMWLTNELKPLVDFVFSENTIKRRGLFNYAPLRKIYNQYYSAANSKFLWRRIWTFVVLEMWLRAYLDPDDIELPPYTGEQVIG